MYYAEKIINGILCCKHTPKGEWIPLTPEQLTKKIQELQSEIQSMHEEQALYGLNMILLCIGLFQEYMVIQFH